MPLPSIGPFELLLVLILALLILGPGKLPEVGSALGKTIREFRRATTDVDTALRPADTSTAGASPTSAAHPVDAPSDQIDREESRAPGR